MRILVACIAGLASHVALSSPLSLLNQRACSLGDPRQVLAMVGAWVAVLLLMRRLFARGSAWYAVAVGWLWGLAATTAYFAFALLLALPSHSGGGLGESILVGLFLCLPVCVLAAPVTVPIGIVCSLVIRHLGDHAAQRRDAAGDASHPS